MFYLGVLGDVRIVLMIPTHHRRRAGRRHVAVGAHWDGILRQSLILPKLEDP
jgi:hypothetical protein